MNELSMLITTQEGTIKTLRSKESVPQKAFLEYRNPKNKEERFVQHLADQEDIIQVTLHHTQQLGTRVHLPLKVTVQWVFDVVQRAAQVRHRLREVRQPGGSRLMQRHHPGRPALKTNYCMLENKLLHNYI